jgi:hypothetical protein
MLSSKKVPFLWYELSNKYAIALDGYNQLRVYFLTWWSVDFPKHSVE